MGVAVMGDVIAILKAARLWGEKQDKARKAAEAAKSEYQAKMREQAAAQERMKEAAAVEQREQREQRAAPSEPDAGGGKAGVEEEAEPKCVGAAPPAHLPPWLRGRVVQGIPGPGRQREARAEGLAHGRRKLQARRISHGARARTKGQIGHLRAARAAQAAGTQGEETARSLPLATAPCAGC